MSEREGLTGIEQGPKGNGTDTQSGKGSVIFR